MSIKLYSRLKGGDNSSKYGIDTVRVLIVNPLGTKNLVHNIETSY